jgi:hypothetical protein
VTNVNDAWQRLSVTFTTTGTVGSVFLSIVTGSASTSGQTCFVDAVQTEQRPAATPYGNPGNYDSISKRQSAWTRGGLLGLSTLTVERSADGGLTWTVLTSAQAVTLPAQTATYDDLAAPVTTLRYRAKVTANA